MSTVFGDWDGSIVEARRMQERLAAEVSLRDDVPETPRWLQDDDTSVKLSAAWLIEQAGWKGRNLGAVGMYEKQALVLVNRGGARGRDVLELMRAVQVDVKEKFGVQLTPEPIFL